MTTLGSEKGFGQRGRREQSEGPNLPEPRGTVIGGGVTHASGQGATGASRRRCGSGSGPGLLSSDSPYRDRFPWLPAGGLGRRRDGPPCAPSFQASDGFRSEVGCGV